LSLVTGLAAAAVDHVAPLPVSAEIALSPEPINVPERQYAHPEHHSVWEGTYVCGQGLSSVKLTIDVDSLGVAMARYDFGPVPSNPVIPKTGAFILVGSLQHSMAGGFTGELDARQWIVRPDDYFMVPLSISTDDGVHLRGRIHHDSCSQFQATRTE
jgi:hypothetical protein